MPYDWKKARKIPPGPMISGHTRIPGLDFRNRSDHVFSIVYEVTHRTLGAISGAGTAPLLTRLSCLTLTFRWHRSIYEPRPSARKVRASRSRCPDLLRVLGGDRGDPRGGHPGCETFVRCALPLVASAHSVSASRPRSARQPCRPGQHAMDLAPEIVKHPVARLPGQEGSSPPASTSSRTGASSSMPCTRHLQIQPATSIARLARLQR